MDFAKKTTILLITVIGWLVGSLSFAADTDMQTYSIVGDWQTIDHKTNHPSTIIRIWESKGKYFGKIAKIYEGEGRNPSLRCTSCEGHLRNQHVLGMMIIQDMQLQGELYHGGTILDPRSGERYHCQITLIENGQKLKVRGYIGFPLLGKVDVWVRAPQLSSVL